MNAISNDAEFKQALQNLDATQQRVIAGKFVEHVLPLSGDERLNRVIEVATESGASQDEINDALKSARSVTMDTYTRCGADGNWTEQAGYFVARAAVAAVSPAAQAKSGNPAWQAAMSSRMARTSLLIDSDSAEVPTHAENEWQYDILSSYLNNN